MILLLVYVTQFQFAHTVPESKYLLMLLYDCNLSAGHSEAVLSVSFSPDGQQLASGSGDTSVRFWDLNTQTPLHTCTGKSCKSGL